MGSGLLELPERLVPVRPRSGRVVVVAPHPDDEVLGVGGTMALLAAAGARVDLVAVTDGEASHPGRRDQLASVRPEESQAAAGVLGVRYGRVVRLGQPDGGVDLGRLVSVLGDHVHDGDLVLAPWPLDGHPDHDVAGAAAAVAAARYGSDIFHYLVWAWHWSIPTSPVIRWAGARRVELGPDLAARKAAAAACFTTQLTGPAPVVPPHVLAHLLRPFEILLPA